MKTTNMPVIDFFDRLKIFQILLGFGMAWWGFRLYGTATFGGSSAYAALALMGDENFWGMTAIIVGLTRVAFAIINGAFHLSVYFRLTSGIIGASFWACVCAGFWLAGSSTAVPPYAMLTAIEFLIVGWAVDDWYRKYR